MEFHEIIRELRDSKKPRINQTQMAEIFHTTQMKISRMETGRAEPSLEDLRNLCKFYNVSADYLLGLPEGLPYPKG